MPVSAMQWPVSAWRKRCDPAMPELAQVERRIASDRIHKTVAELNLNCEAIVFMSMSDL